MRWRYVLLPLLILVPALVAQDEDLPPDEIADIVDRYVERGEESMREGVYDEARLRFKKALRRDPGHVRAHLGTAWCYRVVGAYAKADAQIDKLLAKHPSNRDARVLRAELELLQGRVSKAKDLAAEVVKTSLTEGPDLAGLRARYLIAECQGRRGLRDDARTTLDYFPTYYKARFNAFSVANDNAEEWARDPDKARPIADELTIVAQALRLYVELSPLDHEYLQNAYDLIELAKTLDPRNWAAWIERVRITRIDRERAISRARQVHDIVTKRNPELADLYVEVAKSLLTSFNDGEARKHAETALRVNPKQTDARAIIARVMLQDNEYSDATDHIEAGLKIDPFHRDLLALKATMELLLGNRDEFETGMQAMLRVDKTYGEGFHLAGLIVASRQRRYDTGSALVRRGLKIDPTNFQAHATLGVFLANDGRANEAIESLEKSKKLIPFSHPIRNNFLTVLKYVTGTMTTYKTENFVFRFDPAEHEIMKLFLPPLLEECWTDMVKRYKFTPRRPVLVETFRKADDFSVRTLGIPGIPALGACFGGLITLDSPQALPPGAFLWSATARHEFAHIMSLQLSGGQVPRWFTEGLSMLEEKPLDSGWGKDDRFEREVFDAYHTGTLPEIGKFDAWFRGPRVAYAYYVGGLMLEFLQKRSGEEGIVKALRLYGKDRPMREVFRKAFDLELDEFDKKFHEFIGARVKGYRIVPNYALQMADLRRKVLRNAKDGESLVKLAWAYHRTRRFVDAGDYLDRARRVLGDKHPRVLLLHAHLTRRPRPARARELYEEFLRVGGEDYDARMVLASMYLQENERDKYVAALKAAKAAWPFRVSGNNPYALLRRHYMSKGDEDAALKELEQAVVIASKDLKARLALAAEYEKRNRPMDSIRVLEQNLLITLFNKATHDALLPLYRGAKQKKKAIRTARVRLALRDDETAELDMAFRWVDLAEVLLDDEQKQKAVRALAEAEKLADIGDEPRVKAIKEQLGQ
ncbi:MAG: tetratricopeptide repeat protein [Planctomycetota bacterium]|nr:tetratricopeptide repeat protein [Planctomycetota bacterium]